MNHLKKSQHNSEMKNNTLTFGDDFTVLKEKKNHHCELHLKHSSKTA